MIAFELNTFQKKSNESLATKSATLSYLKHFLILVSVVTGCIAICAFFQRTSANDVKQENLRSEDLSLIKARLLDTALSSYEGFSRDQSPSENLTASEFKALRHLSKNKNIVIQKADKGNTIVILDQIF